MRQKISEMLLHVDDKLFNCFNSVTNKAELIEESKGDYSINEFNQKKVTHPVAMKLIWGYIKQNNLQNEEDKRVIVCDDQLKTLFEEESLSMFKLAGKMNQYLTRVEASQ